jgi:hypothetical protein
MSASYDINYKPNPENDKIWFNLGKTYGILKDKCIRSQFTLLRSYGMSHKLTKCACNLGLDSISSTLDDMVCGSYPPYIYQIIVDDIEVPLTHVFYDFPNPDLSRKNEYAHRQKKYQKALVKEDKEFIEEFVAHVRYFFIELDTINIITTNKHYKLLKKQIVSFLKKLDSFESLLKEAEVIKITE